MQEAIKSEWNQWASCAGEFHLPRWGQLPELELYMDQVIVLIDKSLTGLFASDKNLITPAMVNNYVKLKLVPKPTKKKYNRTHLAYLFVITLLKELFPIADIKAAIQLQTLHQGSDAAAYDLFCDEIEAALQAVAAEIQGSELPAYPPFEPEKHLLRMAARAFACRTAAQLPLMQRNENER